MCNSKRVLGAFQVSERNVFSSVVEVTDGVAAVAAVVAVVGPHTTARTTTIAHVRTAADSLASVAGRKVAGGNAHAGECTRGIGEVALSTGKPVAFGVLTVDTLAQAEERAADNDENKGAEAALSAVAMVNLMIALRRL